MTERLATWATPALSTDDPSAVAAYRHGVAGLVSGAPDAGDFLQDAVTLDPTFFLGQVALAVAAAVAGASFRPLAAPVALSRGERHHAEIVNCAFAGDVARAVALRRDHLVDFPGDLLIVWLPVLVCGSPDR